MATSHSYSSSGANTPKPLEQKGFVHSCGVLRLPDMFGLPLPPIP